MRSLVFATPVEKPMLNPKKGLEKKLYDFHDQDYNYSENT